MPAAKPPAGERQLALPQSKALLLARFHGPSERQGHGALARALVVPLVHELRVLLALRGGTKRPAVFPEPYPNAALPGKVRNLLALIHRPATPKTFDDVMLEAEFPGQA